MSSRSVDWKSFLNKLQYCYGCGRFGIPRKKKGKAVLPSGWSVLYQPYEDAPAMLNVCSTACRARVEKAMQSGPIHEPLEVAKNIPMPADMRRKMMTEAMKHAAKRGRLDDLFKIAIREKKKDE